MRISIKPHHDAYIKLIASQMGSDPTSALDFMLWQLKQQGFSFAHPLPLPVPATQNAYQASLPQPIPVAGKFVPFEEILPQPQPQEDEVVKKFAMLIEEF